MTFNTLSRNSIPFSASLLDENVGTELLDKINNYTQ